MLFLPLSEQAVYLCRKHYQTMKTLKALLVLSMAAAACACSNGDVEKELFLFDVSDVKDVPGEPFALIAAATIDLPVAVGILDTMVFSYKPMGDANYYVFPLSDPDAAPHLACMKGRREDEPMNVFPFKEMYREDGDWKTYLFNLDRSRVLEWNLSKTLTEGRDIFDGVSFLKPDHAVDIIPSAYFHAGDGQILVIDDNLEIAEAAGMMQSRKKAPTLDLYDFQSGELLRSIALFNNSDIASDNWQYNEVLTPNVCVNPAGTKAFVGMAYLPDYCIIDLGSGKATGFKLKDIPPFSESMKRWYFKSAVASGDYIYALFSGAVIKDMFTPPEGNDVLYIIDWSGKIVHKYLLSGQYQDMWHDASTGRTYLINRGTGELATLP